ncbi:hypothetical protein TNCT_11231 [Trichonephila clavata]|uniref:Uncharacterized protein n=1 Tax=Trichonephila clavata TaxID=2740835 RepID=A0A8X6KDD7_TRICU|nr:hypothetical protein TNCT_11231 [Trichonephila clavata]
MSTSVILWIFSSGFIIIASLRKNLTDSGLRRTHKEYSELNDRVELSTQSAQKKFAAITGIGDTPFSSVGGKIIFSPFLVKHRFLPVPSKPPPDHEFPHFSNVPSVTPGGFFKARRRRNVMPVPVQGRSQGGFFDMNESPPPSHPLGPQPLGAFRQNIPQNRYQRRTPLFRDAPFRCQNSIPCERGYKGSTQTP